MTVFHSDHSLGHLPTVGIEKRQMGIELHLHVDEADFEVRLDEPECIRYRLRDIAWLVPVSPLLAVIEHALRHLFNVRGSASADS